MTQIPLRGGSTLGPVIEVGGNIPISEIVVRKHSKQSLSQPTIPEEGPEESDSANIFPQTVVSCKNITSAPCKTLDEFSLKTNPSKELKESPNSIKIDAATSTEEIKFESKKDPVQRPQQEYSKSPKTSRQESVERLFKAIRCTARQETKSKKTPSPTSSLPSTNLASKLAKKESVGRKSTQEKKDSFKSIH